MGGDSYHFVQFLHPELDYSLYAGWGGPQEIEFRVVPVKGYVIGPAASDALMFDQKPDSNHIFEGQCQMQIHQIEFKQLAFHSSS